MPSQAVLIVDDEPLIRWSVRTRLERAGFEVVDAGSGRQALERFETTISLALVDMRLPDTDGLHLIDELKRRQPECQLILMTACGGPELAREAREHGALQVLDKPFDLDELTATIVTTLGSPGMNPP